MNILRIAWGDLKRIAKDWQAALWLLAMPLAFAFIFGNAMRGGGPQTTWIPVVNFDPHELAKIFIEQLEAEGYFIDHKSAQDERELKHKWPYGLVIPADFSDQTLQGKIVKLTVVKGNGSQEKIMEVQSRLLHAIVRFTTGITKADISHRPWNEESKSALKQALARPQLLTVTRQGHRTLKPPPMGFYQSLPGMLVMFVIQMILTYGGATLVADRLRGQWLRLVAAPVYRFEVYLGKVLARVLLALLQAILLLVCGAFLFRMPLGDHPEFLLPVVFGLALFAGCLGILAGILCRNEKQVILIAIFGSMILSALGGCWWPIEIVPDLFKTIAMFTPSYWAMHGLQNVLYFGKSYEVLLLEFPILLGFAAGCGGIILLFARRLERAPGNPTLP